MVIILLYGVCENRANIQSIQPNESTYQLRFLPPFDAVVVLSSTRRIRRDVCAE